MNTPTTPLQRFNRVLPKPTADNAAYINRLLRTLEEEAVKAARETKR